MIATLLAAQSRRRYRVAAGLILFAELGIALFFRDDLVRPYLGDSLAVLLVYCAVRGCTPMGTLASIAAAMAIAFAIEFGQLFGLLGALGLEHNVVARLVLGTGFDPYDFLAYAAGGIAAFLWEAATHRHSN